MSLSTWLRSYGFSLRSCIEKFWKLWGQKEWLLFWLYKLFLLVYWRESAFLYNVFFIVVLTKSLSDLIEFFSVKFFIIILGVLFIYHYNKINKKFEYFKFNIFELIWQLNLIIQYSDRLVCSLKGWIHFLETNQTWQSCSLIMVSKLCL